MKTVTIKNNQKEGKFAGTARDVDFPDWLIDGNLEGFLDDAEIKQEQAFASLCNFAWQHVPVAFRTKDLHIGSGYAWLRGEMQGGSQVRADAIRTLTDAGMKQEALEPKSTKELRSMVELFLLMQGGN